MSKPLITAAIAAAATLALGACSNLTAYPNGYSFSPGGGTTYNATPSNGPGVPAEPVTRTPDKVEGNGAAPAVKGPTAG